MMKKLSTLLVIALALMGGVTSAIMLSGCGGPQIEQEDDDD